MGSQCRADGLERHVHPAMRHLRDLLGGIAHACVHSVGRPERTGQLQFLRLGVNCDDPASSGDHCAVDCRQTHAATSENRNRLARLHLGGIDDRTHPCQDAAADSRFGALDILVNNAGLTGAGVQDVDEIGLFDRLVAVNLRGAFLGIRAAVRRMDGRGGAIVNIASISANIGNPGVHIGYNASKGGVRTLTKAAAAEYGPKKIRVNSVHPGVLPPMLGSKRVEVAESLLSRVPLRRTGELEEVSNAVLFLASDEASYISGAELYVDGGLLAT